MITKKPFGKYSEKETTIFTITDGDYSVSITDFGATIVSFKCPDKSGNITDIVLGYDSVHGYAPLNGFLGATVGRLANRLGNGEFELNGTKYSVNKNVYPNSLHGGTSNFSNKIYNVTENENSLTFSAKSIDNEEGYPGNLEFSVTFTLKDKKLTIDYSATCDKDTIINLTNHSYFNLEGAGTIDNTYIKVNADSYCKTDEQSIPTGELTPVDNTDMDLRNFVKFGDIFKSNYCDIAFTGGIDHNYVLSNKLHNDLTLCAEAKSNTTGIHLLCYTTLPGVQVYTANFLQDKNGKNNTEYKKHYAFCLETQNYPDAIHHSNFPSPILKAGEQYKTTTVYQIEIDK